MVLGATGTFRRWLLDDQSALLALSTAFLPTCNFRRACFGKSSGIIHDGFFD
jgi:hypothetical protein